jgi:hypothetical protein
MDNLKKFKIIIATVAIGVVVIGVGVAYAADLSKNSYQRDVVATGTNLTGPYFTVLGGAEFGSASMSVDDAKLSGLGSRGWLGETGIGYDWQLPGSKFGFGLLASAQIASTKSTLEIDWDLVKITRDWSWLGGGRAFYAPSDATMLYLGGGFTRGDFSSGGDTVSLDGWFGETGIETRLNGPVFGRIAGRYTQYERVGAEGEYFRPSSLEALFGVTVKFSGDRF